MYFKLLFISLFFSSLVASTSDTINQRMTMTLSESGKLDIKSNYLTHFLLRSYDPETSKVGDSKLIKPTKKVISYNLADIEWDGVFPKGIDFKWGVERDFETTSIELSGYDFPNNTDFRNTEFIVRSAGLISLRSKIRKSTLTNDEIKDYLSLFLFNTLTLAEITLESIGNTNVLKRFDKNTIQQLDKYSEYIIKHKDTIKNFGFYLDLCYVATKEIERYMKIVGIDKTSENELAEFFLYYERFIYIVEEIKAIVGMTDSISAGEKETIEEELIIQYKKMLKDTSESLTDSEVLDKVTKEFAKEYSEIEDEKTRTKLIAKYAIEPISSLLVIFQNKFKDELKQKIKDNASKNEIEKLESKINWLKSTRWIASAIGLVFNNDIIYMAKNEPSKLMPMLYDIMYGVYEEILTLDNVTKTANAATSKLLNMFGNNHYKGTTLSNANSYMKKITSSVSAGYTIGAKTLPFLWDLILSPSVIKTTVKNGKFLPYGELNSKIHIYKSNGSKQIEILENTDINKEITLYLKDGEKIYFYVDLEQSKLFDPEVAPWSQEVVVPFTAYDIIYQTTSNGVVHEFMCAKKVLGIESFAHHQRITDSYELLTNQCGSGEIFDIDWFSSKNEIGNVVNTYSLNDIPYVYRLESFSEYPQQFHFTKYGYIYYSKDNNKKILFSIHDINGIITEYNIIVKTDTPPEFLNSEQIFNIDENSTSTILLEAIDESEVTYTKTGTDESYFNLDSKTGVLSFKNSPDYEIKNEYILTVTVTDISGNSLSKNITININNLFESLNCKENEKAVDGQCVPKTCEEDTYNCTNNPPVVTNPKEYTTKENISKDIKLSAIDEEEDALTYEVVVNPSNGTLIGTVPNLTYKPNSDFIGEDYFSFIVKDGINITGPILIKILVEGADSLTSKITSFSPTIAIQNEETTFTIIGENLPDTIAMSLQGSVGDSCNFVSKSSTQVKMSCIPYTTGLMNFYVAKESGGDAIESDVSLKVNVQKAEEKEYTTPIVLNDDTNIGAKYVVTTYNGEKLYSYYDVDVYSNYNYALSGDYQCTDLIKRFYKNIFNIPEEARGNGQDVAKNFDSTLGSYLGIDTKVIYYPNNSSTNPPVNGSIISFDNSDNIGHVAIVKKVEEININTLRVYLAEQNWAYTSSSDAQVYTAHSRYITFTKNSNGIWSGIDDSRSDGKTREVIGYTRIYAKGSVPTITLSNVETITQGEEALFTANLSEPLDSQYSIKIELGNGNGAYLAPIVMTANGTNDTFTYNGVINNNGNRVYRVAIFDGDTRISSWINGTYVVNEKVSENAFESGDSWKGLVYKTITSPHTSRVWLDRNLGANKACSSLMDEECYGDLYQWGRLTDGHEKRDSITRTTRTSDIENAGTNFIIGDNQYDWSFHFNLTHRKDRWSKTDGSSICPVGFRVPTAIEFERETFGDIYSTNIKGCNTNSSSTCQHSLEESFLNIPYTGYRSFKNGELKNIGTSAYLWTSSIGNYQNVFSLIFYAEKGQYGYDLPEANGMAVRCIKDESFTSTNSSEVVLKTGQTTSYVDYDDGYYQKGASRSYTRGNDIVIDHTTGLQWQDDIDAGTITKDWEEAKSYCEAKTLGGYSDWRLPSIKELQTIIDYGKEPSIGVFFENVGLNSGYYSFNKFSNLGVYSVFFRSGATSYSNNNSYTRCVRVGQ